MFKFGLYSLFPHILFYDLQSIRSLSDSFLTSEELNCNILWSSNCKIRAHNACVLREKPVPCHTGASNKRGRAQFDFPRKLQQKVIKNNETLITLQEEVPPLIRDYLRLKPKFKKKNSERDFEQILDFVSRLNVFILHQTKTKQPFFAFYKKVERLSKPT